MVFFKLIFILGTVEFQSEKYYFFDKLKKQEIRVRHGNTYFYEEVGFLP